MRSKQFANNVRTCVKKRKNFDETTSNHHQPKRLLTTDSNDSVNIGFVSAMVCGVKTAERQLDVAT